MFKYIVIWQKLQNGRASWEENVVQYHEHNPNVGCKRVNIRKKNGKRLIGQKSQETRHEAERW
jgi:hypothetical protein